MPEEGVIRLDLHVAHPIDRVWAALTEPALLRKWWAEGDVRPVVGHRFTLDMGAYGQQPCEVLVVEPARRFSYTFADMTLTWLLKPEDGGTRLTLEHAGFDVDTDAGRKALEGMRAGWPAVLGGIERALDASP